MLEEIPANGPGQKNGIQTAKQYGMYWDHRTGRHLCLPDPNMKESLMHLPLNWSKPPFDENTQRPKALGSTFHVLQIAHALSRLSTTFKHKKAIRIFSPCDGIGGLLLALVYLGLGAKITTYACAMRVCELLLFHSVAVVQWECWSAIALSDRYMTCEKEQWCNQQMRYNFEAA